MAQPSFALPEQLRYDHAKSSNLDTDVQVSVVAPFTASSPITIQAGFFLFSML